MARVKYCIRVTTADGDAEYLKFLELRKDSPCSEAEQGDSRHERCPNSFLNIECDCPTHQPAKPTRLLPAREMEIRQWAANQWIHGEPLPDMHARMVTELLAELDRVRDAMLEQTRAWVGSL